MKHATKTHTPGANFPAVAKTSVLKRLKISSIVMKPAYLLLLTLASIFLAEGLITTLLPLVPPYIYDEVRYMELRLIGSVLPMLPPLTIYEGVFVDVFFLIVIILPAVYFFFLRPLKKHMRLRRIMEENQERLIFELKEEKARVRTLTGLLPICASCKMIKDDQGRWKSVEKYIEEHSNAEFSHSICPKCGEKLYPEFFKVKK